MKKVLKILLLLILVLIVIPGLYYFRVISLPLVPVFDVDHDLRPVALITCKQLYRAHWHNISISGEYVSDFGMYGVRYGRIIEPFISHNCPNFAAPR